MGVFKNIRALLSQLSLYCRLEAAIVEEMEDQHRRIYALEENRKQKDAAIQQLQNDVRQLRLAVGQKVTPNG